MSAPARDRVALEVADGIARMTLVRAGAGNAIDAEMVAALGDAAVEIERRARPDDVRAVLIAAEGRAFTVGGDLRYLLVDADRLGEELDGLVVPFHETLLRLASLPVPVVAAVGGPIAGGGLGIAWVADVLLASPQARFATGFHKLGLSGDGGSSWWLPRLIGLRRAQEMILGGRIIDADTALEWGLVTEVLPDEDLLPRAEAVAAQLAAGAPAGLAEMRGNLRASWDRTLAEGYAAETEAMARTGRTADAHEGIVAFNERRPPRFRGV